MPTRPAVGDTGFWSRVLRDNAGNPSSMRLMALIALIAGIVLALAPWAAHFVFLSKVEKIPDTVEQATEIANAYSITGNSEHVLYLLGAAFGGKA